MTKMEFDFKIRRGAVIFSMGQYNFRSDEYQSIQYRHKKYEYLEKFFFIVEHVWLWTE